MTADRGGSGAGAEAGSIFVPSSFIQEMAKLSLILVDTSGAEVQLKATASRQSWLVLNLEANVLLFVVIYGLQL